MTHGFNGVNGRHREWTREEALDAGREWVAEHGEPPTLSELNPALLRTHIAKARERVNELEARERRFVVGKMPGAAVIRRLFGGMDDYLAALGFTPRGAGRPSRQRRREHEVQTREVIEALHDGHRQVLAFLRRAVAASEAELRYQRGKHRGFLRQNVVDDLVELEASGLVEREVKITYRLTDAGRRALDDSVVQQAHTPRGRRARPG